MTPIIVSILREDRTRVVLSVADGQESPEFLEVMEELEANENFEPVEGSEFTFDMVSGDPENGTYVASDRLIFKSMMKILARKGFYFQGAEDTFCIFNSSVSPNAYQMVCQISETPNQEARFLSMEFMDPGNLDHQPRTNAVNSVLTKGRKP